MVEKVGTYGVRKTILIGQESYYIALPCVVTGTANGVIKAGEPLAGDITKRDTAFAAATEGAVGISLHEVKLDANGRGNATLVLAACVDLLKLDEATRGKVNTAKANLNKIIFVEGSAI
jgi:hypothetical protein